MLKFGYQLFLLVFSLGSEAGPGLGSVVWGYIASGIRHPPTLPGSFAPAFLRLFCFQYNIGLVHVFFMFGVRGCLFILVINVEFYLCEKYSYFSLYIFLYCLLFLSLQGICLGGAIIFSFICCYVGVGKHFVFVGVKTKA